MASFTCGCEDMKYVFFYQILYFSKVRIINVLMDISLDLVVFVFII